MLELRNFHEIQNCSALNKLSNATKFVSIRCQKKLKKLKKKLKKK